MSKVSTRKQFLSRLLGFTAVAGVLGRGWFGRSAGISGSSSAIEPGFRLRIDNRSVPRQPDRT